MTDNQEIEAGELAVRGIVWLSPAMPKETGQEAAKRFTREHFGVERIPQFYAEGKFKFDDGYWFYQIEFSNGKWVVKRLLEQTPKAKKRSRARKQV
jgi:hypothetical protein